MFFSSRFFFLFLFFFFKFIFLGKKWGDCIDIICALSTLALVFKATKRGQEKKKKRSLLWLQTKQGQQVFLDEGVFSVIAPFGRGTGARGCVGERVCVCVRVCVRAFSSPCTRGDQARAGLTGLKQDHRMNHDCN